MRKSVWLSLALWLLSASLAHADFVILRDGRSYSGTFTGAPGGKLGFQDNAGIQYTFPLNDVQTVVFSNVSDHIALRNGHSYTGHLTAVRSISFAGTNGISYVFPLKDVSSLVLTGGSPGSVSAGASAATGGQPSLAERPAAPSGKSSVAAIVIPSGTTISVRTDETIDTTKDSPGHLYAANIQHSVVDSTSNIAIPAGAPAKLRVVSLKGQANGQSSDLALDLYSIELNGKQYRVDTSSVTEKGAADFGVNKRTAIYSGGGAALGALLGAVFGGGRGAGIGTLAGAGAGAVTQYATRGKVVKVPAESQLQFNLQHALVLHP
jgi:outer membrane lipoprotein SlyB